MAAIGDIVIYTNTQAERDESGASETEWPAIVVTAHTATDCTLAVLRFGEVYGGVDSKRCDEDNSAPYAEGTWRPAS